VSGVGPRAPTGVLSQRFAEALGGRRVRSAVFTTYTFDPCFFELQVLPLLFAQQSFSQIEKVRALQLEDALREVDQLAVYYDRGALSQDAGPARLDYRRLDVRRATGAFHPKLALLLVEDPQEEAPGGGAGGPRSLIIGCFSANLTRAGWWENVECAHFEEVRDKEVDPGRCPFRRDLLAVVRRIRSSAPTGDDHAALDAVHEFLRQRVSAETYAYASHGGRWHTRLFGGEGGAGLADWLRSASLHRHEWNLEVISPFFDGRDAGALRALVEALAPKQTRVWLPSGDDGEALVRKETYEDAQALGARWSELPQELTARGRGGTGERLAPRRVHAKVYRLWHQDGRQVVLCGSANCTRAGHGPGHAGNLEASFLVDRSAAGGRARWWLEALDEERVRFADAPPGEDEGLDAVPIDVTLRYDWSCERLSYRVESAPRGAIGVETLAGVPLFTIDAPVAGDWQDLAPQPARLVGDELPSGSFFVVRCGDDRWRVLVREEGMAHRPSLLSALGPEEILEYWSLLNAEQRAAFLEHHAALDERLEGLPVIRGQALSSRGTLFDRFAGIFHAFGCLRRHVDTALAEGREAEAEVRLLGAKYDSLPELLRTMLAPEEADPVIRYVTFLSARQLRDTLAQRHRGFFAARAQAVARLDAWLARLDELRAALPLACDGERDAFLAWYEGCFLEELGPERISRGERVRPG